MEYTRATKLQVVQEIKFLTRTHKPDIIFLPETIINKTNILKILPTMGYGHFDYILPTIHSGGIVVLLNNSNIHASILLKEQREIHMLLDKYNVCMGILDYLGSKFGINLH